jgi:hypothetical protein
VFHAAKHIIHECYTRLRGLMRGTSSATSLGQCPLFGICSSLCSLLRIVYCANSMSENSIVVEFSSSRHGYLVLLSRPYINLLVIHHRHHNPDTPRTIPNTAINNQWSPAQNIIPASQLCQLPPSKSCQKPNPPVSSFISTLTLPPSSFPSLHPSHSVHKALKNSGPVLNITSKYGLPNFHFLSYLSKLSITFLKNGCLGTAPRTSFEIPVGEVRHAKAG